MTGPALRLDETEDTPRACPTCGSTLGLLADGACWNHSALVSDNERQAARMRGGMSFAKKMRRGLEPGELGPPPKTPEDVIRRAHVVSEAVAVGRITPQQALAITRSDATALKAWEQLALLPRIKRLEENLAKKGAG